jgi:ASC-1-like (ASCH) protein
MIEQSPVNVKFVLFAGENVAIFLRGNIWRFAVFLRLGYNSYILPEYFETVVSGKKKYELRLNDFEIAEGDILILEEWNAEAKAYTGRSIEKRVTYVGRFKLDELFWPVQEIMDKGIQIISME